MSSVAVMPLKSAIQLEADSHSAAQLRLRVSPEVALVSAMENKRSRYQTLGWRLAREWIGQLVRENCRVIKIKKCPNDWPRSSKR